MKNDPNIQELLKKGEVRIPEKKRNDQERTAPDPFFREAIKEAIERNSGMPDPSKKKARRVLRPRKIWNWIRKGWRWFAVEVVLVFFTVWLLFHVIFDIFLVSGDSMKPEIQDGDRVVIFQLARSFEPGDIIVFRTSEGETRIKRVIAVEGDTVDISPQGVLFINGEAAEEDYIYETTEITDQNVRYPITVDENSYFVLGDNRGKSQDSRNQEIGLVQKEEIIGRVVLSIRSF
ncbi:signal peptidase I [Zhenpiania hominis]|uniref:signal peptidase I n=1 Tax=Zhenpiania hominis TaxID=2763644 RepID=UPI0039F5F16C